MSYVLEALKKREAEQNPDVAVSLSLANERHHRYRLLTWLVGVTLVVNAGILFWFLAWPQLQQERSVSVAGPNAEAGSSSRSAQLPAASATNGPQMSPPEAAANNTSSPASRPSAELSAEPSAEALPGAAGNAAAKAAAAAEAATAARAAQPAPDEPAKVEPVRNPVQLDRLPPDVRRRFPGLAFSTHVYAEDRDLRAVVANGQRLTEGDSLRGVTVDEITETGVVLAFDGYLVEVPVAGYWD